MYTYIEPCVCRSVGFSKNDLHAMTFCSEMWYIQHCGHCAGCMVFDWQCEKKNCKLEYKVQVVS